MIRTTSLCSSLLQQANTTPTCLRLAPRFGPRGSFPSCWPAKLLIPRFTLQNPYTTLPRLIAIRIRRIVPDDTSSIQEIIEFSPSESQHDVMNEPTPSPTPAPASKLSKSPPSTAGTKRKRVSAGKYYAVKVGYQPGIYYEWKDCLAQITGFKGSSKLSRRSKKQMRLLPGPHLTRRGARRRSERSRRDSTRFNEDTNLASTPTGRMRRSRSRDSRSLAIRSFQQKRRRRNSSDLLSLRGMHPQKQSSRAPQD
ncbi:hypothetical protein BDV12DRAFT_27841 [Aspergillus spectabilis]